MNQDSERTVLAAEIMTESVITVPQNATVQEVAQLMLTNRIGSVVVTDENGDYAGMLTERMMLPTHVMVPFMRGKTLRLLGKEVGSIDNIEETMDEVFITHEAAAGGVTVQNTGREPLVSLRYFGPDTFASVPNVGDYRN